MTNDTSQPSSLFTSSLFNLVPFYGYNPHGVPASDQQLLPHDTPSSSSNPYDVPTSSHQPLPHNVPSSSSNQVPFYKYNPHGIPTSSQQPLPHNVPSSSSMLQPSHTPPIYQDIPSNQLWMSSFIGTRCPSDYSSLSSAIGSLHRTSSSMTAPTLTTSDDALEARLKLPLHQPSGPSADTLGVLRSKRSMGRLHESYELALRAAKSRQPSTAGQSSTGSLFHSLWAMSKGNYIILYYFVNNADESFQLQVRVAHPCKSKVTTRLTSNLLNIFIWSTFSLPMDGPSRLKLRTSAFVKLSTRPTWTPLHPVFY